MPKETKNLIIPISLVGIIATSLIGFGHLKAEVKDNKEEVKALRAEVKQLEKDKTEEKVMLKELEVNQEYIKKLLEKIAEDLDKPNG
jgi:cell division protein FtsB